MTSTPLGSLEEPPFCLVTLGRPRVIVRGEERAISSVKQVLLLARLARSPDRAASREQLATFLWPGHPPSNGRTSLRQALTRLRGVIDAPEDPFEIETGRVALAADRWVVDLDDIDPVACDATSLVFLDGLEFAEPELQDWVERERRNIAAEVEGVMLGRLRCLQGDEAISIALRLLALDPLHEEANRRLMSLYAEKGRRARALGVFETFRKRLEESIGDVPMEETRRLAARIRRADSPADAAAQIHKVAPSGSGAPMEKASEPPIRDHASLMARSRVSLAATPFTSASSAIAAAALVVVVFVAGREAMPPVASDRSGAEHGASGSRVAVVAERAIDVPSIAVLAFENMTGDPGKEHVGDGISEDIITTLARLPGLAVVARNSSFAYKRGPVDVRNIADELGVRYVLEGSLQEFETEVRVTAQLIDAASGHHVWSRSFDRRRADFFEVRDEITHAIVAEMNSALLEGYAFWNDADTFSSVETWLLARKARYHAFRFTRVENQIAIDVLHEILASESGSSWAHGFLAFRHAWIFRLGWNEDVEAALRLAERHAERAIEINGSAPFGYSALAFVRYSQGRFSEAIAQSERALELAPGDAEERGMLGIYLQKAGQVERSLDLFEQAARMNRKAPGWFWESYGESLRIAGRHREAVEIYRTALDQGVQGLSEAEVRLGLAVAHDALGQSAKASNQVAAAIEALPEVSVSLMRRAIPYEDHEDKERWLATLTRLGLPME